MSDRGDIGQICQKWQDMKRQCEEFDTVLFNYLVSLIWLIIIHFILNYILQRKKLRVMNQEEDEGGMIELIDLTTEVVSSSSPSSSAPLSPNEDEEVSKYNIY